MEKHKFKYVNLPEGVEVSDDNVKFLETIDKGLIEAVKGASRKEDIDTLKETVNKQFADLKKDFDYELMKEQLAELYKKIDPLARTPRTAEEEKAKERALNQKWVKAFLKRDSMTLKEIQEVWPYHVLHTGANENIDSGSTAQGGYLIPELFNAEINRFVELGGVARQEMRYLPFSGPGNERKLHTLLTSVSVSWVDEGEIKPKDKPTFAQLTQELKTLAVIVIMTEEIIEDSAIDLVSLSSQLIGEAIAIEEDAQFFAGVGAPWTGIINAGGIVPVPMGVGQLAADVTPDHLLAMQSQIPVTAKTGAKYYMHPSVFDVLRGYRFATIAAGDGEGGYVVQPPTAGAPASLWGYPVIQTEALPSVVDVAAVDTPFLIFSNLARTCVYGDKQGIRMKILDQATVTDAAGATINLAERDMLALRVHKRVGYLPLLPAGIAVLQSGPVS